MQYRSNKISTTCSANGTGREWGGAIETLATTGHLEWFIQPRMRTTEAKNKLPTKEVKPVYL